MSRATAKARGAEAELWPVDYARERGLEADTIRQRGGVSLPDWWVYRQDRLWVVQSKARKDLSIGAVLKEAEQQAANYAASRCMVEPPPYALCVRPYGKGKQSIGDWWMVQPLKQWLDT